MKKNNEIQILGGGYIGYLETKPLEPDPLYPTGIKANENNDPINPMDQPEPSDYITLQKEADELNILLPTQFNAKPK